MNGMGKKARLAVRMFTESISVIHHHPVELQEWGKKAFVIETLIVDKYGYNPPALETKISRPGYPLAAVGRRIRRLDIDLRRLGFCHS